MQDALTIPERDAEHERVLGIVFDLSPAQAKVLSCLVRGTIRTRGELLAYANVKPPIKIVVSRTRAKLRAHGFDIKSRIGFGYWVEQTDRKGIEAEIAKFLERL